VIVVGPRRHRRPGIEAENAAIGQRPRLRRVRAHPSELLLSRDRGVGILLPLGFSRERRDAAIGRIDDERGALRADDAAAALVPELVVRNHASRQILQAAFLRIDQVTVLPLVLLALEARRFGIGERRLVAEISRPLEWCDSAEVPLLTTFLTTLPKACSVCDNLSHKSFSFPCTGFQPAFKNIANRPGSSFTIRRL